jgi:hypothetical protein
MKKKKKPARPKRLARAKSAAGRRTFAAPAVTELFRAREKMRVPVARDRSRRYQEFLSEVEQPAESPSFETALRSLAVVPGKRNLLILAEADSWFEYPIPITHDDGVIYQLEKRLG